MVSKSIPKLQSQRLLSLLQFHNALINMYTKCGQPNTAISLWEMIRNNNSVTASSVTYNCVLAACADIGPPAITVGTQIHSLLIKDKVEQEDIVVALLNMYTRCGQPLNSLALWKNFTSSFDTKTGLSALPGLYTAIFTACSLVRTAEALEVGLAAQSMMEGSLASFDPITNTAMVQMFLRCGDPNTALSLCTSLLFRDSDKLDNIWMISALSVCSTLGNSTSLQVGNQLAHIVNNSSVLRVDISVLTALIGMYERCGKADTAISMWKDTISRNIHPTHLTYPCSL
jgi:pentatricopeptide repeat protein